MAPLSTPASDAPSSGETGVNDSTTRCQSCGGAMGTSYCGSCGQLSHRGRLTLRSVAGRAARTVVNVDRGLLYTAVCLIRRPGTLIRDYIDGRTVRYTSPFRYLLIMVALTTFISIQSDVPNDIARGIVEGLDAGGSNRAPDADGADVSAFESTLRDYLNVFLILGIPFMAVWTRLFFRSAGLNIAEHLVLHAYLFAQICLLSVLAIPLAWIGVSPTLREVIIVVMASVLFVWVCIDSFETRTVRGVMQALAAWVMTAFSYLLGAGALIAIVHTIRMG